MEGKKREIKYIGFYNDDSFNEHENRNTSLAVKNKMDYITSTLVKNNIQVKIISPCWSNNSKGFYRGKEYKKSENVIIKNFATFGSKNLILNQLKKIFSAIQLLLYLILSTKKNEEIIVYHSIALMLPIKLVKRIKRITVILEVEEIYSTVWKGISDIEKEISYIKQADKAIFASDYLQDTFNELEGVVVYGSYNHYKRKESEVKDSQIINLVYAGSIDDLRGGAKNAIETMKYLPDNYRLHILGFGNESAIKNMENEIRLLNKSKGYQSCKYHGSLDGCEYTNFLLQCHIGLNPQKKGDYMDYAFPSKVLSYLSHGLEVVSTEINSVKKSKVSPYITFAKSDKPREFADAIKSIKLSNDEQVNEYNIVKELDEKFTEELGLLLNL